MGKWKGTDFDKTCGDCIHADICNDCMDELLNIINDYCTNAIVMKGA